MGVILLLVGVGWASQGAGMMGGSSLMDNNSTFLYLGSLIAIVGVVLIAVGIVTRDKVGASTR